MTKPRKGTPPSKEPPDDCPPVVSMHPKRIANKNATCPSASRADVRLLLEACWAQGAWIELGGNGHYKVWSPDKAQRVVSIPNTPSGYRTLRNVRSLLRRSGLDPAYLKKR